MFLIAESETTSNTKLVDMCMIYLHVKFQMPNSDGPLVIANERLI
jgi:hypothetical protein